MLRSGGILIFFLTVVGCSDGSAGDANDPSCDGSQSDYDSAYDACFSDGQTDVCAGEDRGANYDQDSHDLCDDGLGDQSLSGCEMGYADGYDGGCA